MYQIQMADGSVQTFNSYQDLYNSYINNAPMYRNASLTDTSTGQSVPFSQVPIMDQTSFSSAFPDASQQPVTAPQPSPTYPNGTILNPISSTGPDTQSGIQNQIPGVSGQQQDILNNYIGQLGTLGQNQFTQMQGNVGTVNNDISSLINNAIGQAGALGQTNYQNLQPLLNSYLSSETQSLTDPNSPLYQQMAGNLNNSGVFNGGAFNSALASQLAPLAAQNQYTLGLDTLIPAYQNEQSILGLGTGAQVGNTAQELSPVLSAQNAQTGLVGNEAGVQSNLGLDPLQQYMQEYWWNQQSNLANQLAKQGASSQFGSGLGGLLGGGLGAGIGYGIGGPVGGLIGSQVGSGGGSAIGAGSSGTWICTAMRKRGLLTQEQVDTLHKHLFKAFWKRPFKMTMYFLFGHMLVKLAEDTFTDWKVWKSEFYDDVLAESDSAKAVDLYELTFWKLYENVHENLKKMETINAI